MHGLEDDDEEVEAGYANSEYIEPEDPHPNEFEVIVGSTLHMWRI